MLKFDEKAEGTTSTQPTSHPSAVFETRTGDSGGDVENTTRDVRLKGVVEAEAVIASWTTPLCVLFCLSGLLLTFFNALESQSLGPLRPYALSSFDAHGLTAATSIVSNIVGGVAKLPFARITDIWGRGVGLTVTTVFDVLGLLIAAACTGTVGFSVAQVFQTVGIEGVGLVINVFAADISNVKYRSLVYAVLGLPRIATTFAGPALAQQFLHHSTWRWGFGTFAVLIPVMTLPLLVVYLFTLRKARAEGRVAQKTPRSGSWSQKLVQTLIEWDAIGMALLVAGFSFILLPLAIATYQAHKWRSAAIIVLMVLGGFILVAFIFWERVAPFKIVSYHVLKDRTVLGGCAVLFIQWMGLRCYESYFSSYLQVVYDQSVENAGYINNIYSLGASVFGLIVACGISYWGRVKWIALGLLPIKVLGTGLMIYFRNQTKYIGYVVMTQVFISFGEAGLLLCSEMAILSRVEHADAAMIWALMALFESIGASVGLSISGAIWTNTLPEYLEKYLPDSSKRQASRIYGSLRKQLSYPWGSAEREAINAAYAVAQGRILIAATAIFSLTVVFILMWNNVKVNRGSRWRGSAATR
ncbi:uncharacterized protein PV06_00757 [Exophiala oligosperma]|uniref:Major facilitator superfamily (MFS) profile domain-containing protein n=2 Tax=Chaetothyriales TaxID=34395 RepID=A0A0D2DYH0_9EURO|nr:uncharacterized protein PV06_00757 [Exophiala oligosperma]KAJ9618602.1 hypothetical protein H2204_012955 [Knufia peltigerae]KIW48138.1 hypothetical protein PV06_00757 [Exophiala oligosperma]